ncbi:hypothetical protein ACD661_12040 [Legionella lytica]|uniref:Substrate of the Dot/Icm secretion system n=1 Tax=Legionella lytica TaxID=96232 RepID=A0ABW8D988_9GAMM
MLTNIKNTCSELQVVKSDSETTENPPEGHPLRAEKPYRALSWSKAYQTTTHPDFDFVSLSIEVMNDKMTVFASSFNEKTKTYAIHDESSHQVKKDSKDNAEVHYSMATKTLNIYAERVYDITQLKKVSTAQFLPSMLFAPQDFVIPPESNGRSMVQVKLGQLFISFSPGGKESFTLQIQRIDATKNKLVPFLNIAVGRYPEYIHFENLLPISLNAFYNSRTCIGPRFHEWVKNKEGLAHAACIKQGLTQLALNQSLTEHELHLFQESYINLLISCQKDFCAASNSAPIFTLPDNKLTSNIKEVAFRILRTMKENKGMNFEQLTPILKCLKTPTQEVLHELITSTLHTGEKLEDMGLTITYLQEIITKLNTIPKEMSHFMRHPEEKPLFFSEIAGKIAAISLANLGIDADELLAVFLEYLEMNPLVQSEFIDAYMIQKVANTLVDKQRYNLTAILNDESRDDLWQIPNKLHLHQIEEIQQPKCFI